MKRLFILGSGFAGVWAALSALRVNALDKSGGLEIYLVSSSTSLGIRPRFYEGEMEDAVVELNEIFDGLDIKILNETVEVIDVVRKRIQTNQSVHEFDALVYALGSEVVKPVFANAPRFFSIDSKTDAAKFDRFIDESRDEHELSIGIVGAGFTGLELAMELPKRLRKLNRRSCQIYLIERSKDIAPEYGDQARKLIHSALESESIKILTNVNVESFDGGTLAFENHHALLLDALVWTAGVRPPSLSKQLSNSLDGLGRILTNRFLGVPEHEFIWVAGDVAAPLTDGEHRSAMSCQHAMPQGRLAGFNAASYLLRRTQKKYKQNLYVNCLDLGDWGALLTSGWSREKVLASGQDAKRIKVMINRHTIYPPKGRGSKKLNAAKPDSLGYFNSKILEAALSSKFLRNLITRRFGSVQS